MTSVGYTMHLVNNTTQPWYFCIYQKYENPLSGGQLAPVAWQTEGLSSGESAVATWSLDFSAAKCRQHTEGSVTYNESLLKPTDLGARVWNLVKDPLDTDRLDLVEDSTVNAVAGQVWIDNKTDIPSILGLGLSGKISAVSDRPIPGDVVLKMNVHPTYYVGLSSNKVINSQLVDGTLFADNQVEVKYEGSTRERTVTASDKSGKLVLTVA